MCTNGAVRFVDTNVLLYAISKDPAEARKTRVALGLLAERDIALSVQVLQEFYVQATRTGRTNPLTSKQASALAESWLRFPVQATSVELMEAGFAACVKFRISYWDATIVEAARLMECAVLLTEDLQDGQDFDGVRVVNPFVTTRP
jgi:predicted nucleic acid-binding protein